MVVRVAGQPSNLCAGPACGRRQPHDATCATPWAASRDQSNESHAPISSTGNLEQGVQRALGIMTVSTVLKRFVGVGVLVTVACGSQPASERPQPSSASPVAGVQQTSTALPLRVSINAIMVALVDHASHHLWNAEREGMTPRSDDEWRAVEEHATQLAAAAPLLSIPGTGPTDAVWVKNPSWRGHAQRMADAALEGLTAARSKKLDALVAANGRLVESCEGCHKEFKPALPTEGIVHAHPH